MSDRDPAEAIAASALAILADRGIKGLTVRAVASAAGMSTTGIYTYFGGKQGLLDALFVEGFDDFRAFLAEADADPSPLAALSDAASRYRAWARDHPTHYLLMFGARAAGYEPRPDAGARGMLAFEDYVQRVARAVDSGDLAGDPTEVAIHLWSGIHGYVSLEIAGPGPAPNDPAAFYEEGVRRLIAGFTPGGGSSSARPPGR